MHSQVRLSVLILILFFTTSALSSKDFRTCSKEGMVAIYVNGIMTTREEVIAIENLLRHRLETNYRAELLDVMSVDVTHIYNPSDIVPKGTLRDNTAPFVQDLWESIMFALQEETNRKTAALWTSIYLKLGGDRLNEMTGLDLKTIIEANLLKFRPAFDLNTRDSQLALQNLESLTQTYFGQGKKVLHVAHSQGGFITRQLATKIMGLAEYSEQKKTYGAIFLGTPISSLPNSNEKGQFSYLSSHQDYVVKWVGTSLPSNIDVPGTTDGHGVIATYFSTLPASQSGVFSKVDRFFYDAVRGSVATFDNNDETCCNKENGKLWRNSGSCENDECLGGFIADSVDIKETLTDRVSLDLDSSLCHGTVLGNDLSLDMIDSSVDGPIYLNGRVRLTSSTAKTAELPSMDQPSRTLSSIDGFTAEVRLKNSSLNGRYRIENGAGLDDVVLEGAAKIEDATLNGVTLNGDAAEGRPGLEIRKNPDCADSLKILGGSSFSGNVKAYACGDIVNTQISGHALLSGNIFAINTKINAGSFSPAEAPLRVEASHGTQGIRLVNAVTINGKPLLSGDLTVMGVSIDSGTYLGIGHDFNGFFVSPLLYGNATAQNPRARVFGGNNSFYGTFSVDANLSGVKLEGGFEPIDEDTWSTLWIYDTSSVAAGAEIRGLAGVAGTVSGTSKIDGYKVMNGNLVGGWGVFVNAAAAVSGSSLLEGSIAFEDSTIHSSTVKGIGLEENGNYTHIYAGSNLSNGTIVNGEGIIRGSTLNGASIHGFFFNILEAQLNGTTVNGATTLCNHTYGSLTYGPSHDCTQGPAPLMTGAQKSSAAIQRVQDRYKAASTDHLQRLANVEAIRVAIRGER